MKSQEQNGTPQTSEEVNPVINILSGTPDMNKIDMMLQMTPFAKGVTSELATIKDVLGKMAPALDQLMRTATELEPIIKMVKGQQPGVAVQPDPTQPIYEPSQSLEVQQPLPNVAAPVGAAVAPAPNWQNIMSMVLQFTQAMKGADPAPQQQNPLGALAEVFPLLENLLGMYDNLQDRVVKNLVASNKVMKGVKEITTDG